jgi:hypothetical protein
MFAICNLFLGPLWQALASPNDEARESYIFVLWLLGEKTFSPSSFFAWFWLLKPFLHVHVWQGF